MLKINITVYYNIGTSSLEHLDFVLYNTVANAAVSIKRMSNELHRSVEGYFCHIYNNSHYNIKYIRAPDLISLRVSRVTYVSGQRTEYENRGLHVFNIMMCWSNRVCRRRRVVVCVRAKLVIVLTYIQWFINMRCGDDSFMNKRWVVVVSYTIDVIILAVLDLARFAARPVLFYYNLSYLFTDGLMRQEPTESYSRNTEARVYSRTVTRDLTVRRTII